MKRTNLFLLIFLIICCYTANAQREKLDSLLRVNESYKKEDTAKVLLLIDIMRECKKLKLNKERFVFADAAVALGEKLKFLKPLPAVYNLMGLYYEGRADYERSIAAYTRAVEICELLGDKFNAAGYSLNFGTVYQLLTDYPRSLALYQKAANYYLETNPTGFAGDLANCYVNIGGIYLEFSNQTEQALSFLDKAFVLFKKLDDKRGMAETTLSGGNAYFAAADTTLIRLHIDPKEKYAFSKKYYEKALEYGKAINDSSVQAEVNNAMGILEEKQMNYDAAVTNFQNALLIYKLNDENRYVAMQQLNLGRVYKKKNDIQNSLGYLHTALAKSRQMKVLDIQSDTYFNLSGVHESLKHFDSAYYYYKQYIVSRDSIFNTEKQKEITRKQMQFEFGYKERDYKLNQQLAESKIKEQEGIAIRQQQEISLRNKQLELTNGEKEIQKLNYLQKQSELEAKQKLDASLLSQKDLEEKLTTQASDEKINKQQLQISFDQKLTGFLGVMLLLLTSAGFFVYKAKQRTSRLNELVSAQKAELEEMGKVKDKIFSIVSHDMRAPVNNLVAFSSLLEDGYIEQDKLVQYIDHIKGTLDHTSSLMENLLNWAASQMQGFTPVSEKVNSKPLVQNVVEGIESAAAKKKITINNKITEDNFMQGDKNMIELIIRNLVSNAVKFSRNNSSLEIFSEKKGNDTKLSIKDSGVGLSEAKVKTINGNSVHTLESTYGTEKEKGTGLGLMLCKHFAFLMKGSITVESKEGSGSVFTLSLPSWES